MYQHVKRSRSLDFWKQVCWEIRMDQASNSATLALFPLLSHDHVIILSCYHMIMLSYMIMCIIFKASSFPPCSNHLPFLFSILVYHPTLKMSPFLIAFVFQDVSASIQFNVQLWWQFGKMWNLNFYEMAKEERVPIYQYIWQTIYCNIKAFRVNI